MLDQFDPSTIALAVLIWPTAKSIVFLGAAAATLWSRQENRRAAAERILRLIHGDPDEEDKS